MRFVQLMKICDWSVPFSINDLGCGYGALLSLVAERWPTATLDYLGVDLAPAMITAARRRWKRRHGTQFEIGSRSPRTADYSVASGLFNVKLDHPQDSWLHFVRTTLRQLHATSRKGFAVNFLAASSGVEFAPELFATNSSDWENFCRNDLDAVVQTIDDYGMREFTLLVRHRE
ncbi:MAG: methyltransferase [Ramlibacter sp.]|nr:methyltransferase [Ramlibacter sp.]